MAEQNHRWGLESPPAIPLGDAHADVAQLVERWLPKPKVAGSRPVVRFSVCAAFRSGCLQKMRLSGRGSQGGCAAFPRVSCPSRDVWSHMGRIGGVAAPAHEVIPSWFEPEPIWCRLDRDPRHLRLRPRRQGGTRAAALRRARRRARADSARAHGLRAPAGRCSGSRGATSTARYSSWAARRRPACSHGRPADQAARANGAMPAIDRRTDQVDARANRHAAALPDSGRSDLARVELPTGRMDNRPGRPPRHRA